MVKHIPRLVHPRESKRERKREREKLGRHAAALARALFNYVPTSARDVLPELEPFSRIERAPREL